MGDQVLLRPRILCLFIFRIFSHKNDQFFTVKFTIKYTRMLRMREQSVAGLLFFPQRPVEEANVVPPSSVHPKHAGMSTLNYITIYSLLIQYLIHHNYACMCSHCILLYLFSVLVGVASCLVEGPGQVPLPQYPLSVRSHDILRT